MRKLFTHFALVLATFVAAAGTLHAQQINTIASGTTAMELNPSFVAAFANFGATFADLNLAALPNQSTVFPIANGVVDLNTVRGEVRYGSGVTILANGSVIKMEDWVLDLTGPTAMISALFVVDGSIRGRFPMFLVQPPVDMYLPLQPQNGNLTIQQASLFLTQAGASSFNSLFGLSGSTQLQANMPVGNIDVYAVLSQP